MTDDDRVFRTSAVIAALALSALVASPIATAGASDNAPRASKYVRTTAPASVKLTTRAPQRYVVQVRGTTVAKERQRATHYGLTLTANAAQRVRTNVVTSQTAVVRASGGKIAYRYTDTINGFSATLTPAAVARLRARADVVAVTPVKQVKRLNTRSNTYTGAKTAWTGAGVNAGSGQRIAIIDDGIDYTHKTFGGVGTVAAFNAATANKNSFTPTAKVVGGQDFVGDAYNGDNTPAPDKNPIACGEHGTHVAGTAAGFGVTASNQTYTGSYNGSLPSTLKIGPGSAPKALLLAYKVFGCTGGSGDDVIIGAMDKAVQAKASVINLSLGSDFGQSPDPLVDSVNGASDAGAVVVVAAGNAGHAPYIVGSPAVAEQAITVAALDAIPTFPGATLTIDGTDLDAINANDADLASLPAGALITEDLQLGCVAGDYASAGGKIAVVKRGTCGRVEKAQLAQTAGAVGIIMINTDESFPPFEGTVAGLTIPFLGVPASAAALLGTNSGTAPTIVAKQLDNPGLGKPSSFTSSGPRLGDGGIKPDVIAPGVSIVSAEVGTGFGALTLSGTSMATPHVAGIAALIRAAHPTWRPADVKASLVNTGTGADRLVQPVKALTAGVVGLSGVSYGVQNPVGALDLTRSVVLRNLSSTTKTTTLTPTSGALTVTPASVTLAAGATRAVSVRLRLSVSELAALEPANSSGTLAPWRASITLGTGTSIPVQAIIHPSSRVAAGKPVLGDTTVNIPVTNNGNFAGDADVFQLITSINRKDASATLPIRAVGVQSFDAGELSTVAGDKLIVFAVNTWTSLQSPALQEFDIELDPGLDGTYEYLLLGIDPGLIDGSGPTGFLDSVLLKQVGVDYTVIGQFSAAAPADGSVVKLPVLASDLGLTAEQPKAIVRAAGKSGTYNLRQTTLGTDDYRESIAAGASVTLTESYAAPGSGETAPLGWLVTTYDDRAGAYEADTVSLPS